MSFRAKCPGCGRRQSLEESDIGHTVWCAACGNRFVVQWAPPEPEATDSAIPDIDFPANFTTQGFAPVAPPQPSPPPQPPQALQLAPPQPAPLPPPEQIYTEPEPIVAPPPQNVLIPILIGLVAVLGLALVGGLFTIIHLLNRPPIQTVVVAPAPAAPVTVPVTPTPEPVVPEPMVEPTSKPIVSVARVKDTPKHAPIVPPVVHATPSSPPHFVPVRAPITAPDLDEQIGRSIDQGVNYLLSQFIDGKLRDADNSGSSGPGMDALAVYALLQAGEATHDLRLGPTSPGVPKMLDALKALSMDGEDATYSHSLRAAALGVYHRIDDKKVLIDDAKWLMSAASNGAYTYGMPPSSANKPQQGIRERLRELDGWDNSNSQYGALGVWAALEAGVEVPNAYWQAVEKHWLRCQLPDGEWAYRGYGDMGRMSMTVAGITTLLVAEDQLDAKAVVTTLGHAPFPPALLHGLNWLEAGNNSVTLPPTWPSYSLFGLERAALASGFKYFGTHDWYRELAVQQLSDQQSNGSWSNQNPIVDTAYTLLFLSRGRHPIFMNKLRFDGFWSNRPRDIANLTHYASRELERPLNWQVVSLKSDWTDWMDSPILYIASHEAVKFTDDDCQKLRSFAENGGLIFTHADGDSPTFSKSIAELSHRLFPQYALAVLPTTHPIFSTLYNIKLQPKLEGISNGSRLLLVHSPTDLNKIWQQQDWQERPTDFQMGVNIFIYASGKANLRNKLKTPLVADAHVTPILTKQIAELKYNGNYNPEPASLPRFAKLFLNDTSVKLDVIDADPANLDPEKMPLVHLTGVGAVPYDTMQLKAIHDYVSNGGILLIDPCGASPVFLKSMLLDFAPHAFPKSLFQDMQSDNPILAGKGAGMTPVTLKLRPYRTELDGTTRQPIEYFNLGSGMVIFSTVDLTTGMLGTNTWGVNGYEPATVYDIMRNALLYSLEK
jgi:hypothetical protein